MKNLFLVLFLLFFINDSDSQVLDITKPCTESNLNQYDDFIKKNGPSDDAFVAVQRVAEPFIAKQDWAGAVDVFKKYGPFFKTKVMISKFAKIIQTLVAKTEGIIIKNIGTGINTQGSEYSPQITADGQRFYFTGINRSDCIGREDIFESELKNNEWQKAINLGKNINTSSNENITGVSADGNSLNIFGNYRGSLGSGDIFYVEKSDTGWGQIKHHDAPINSAYFDCDGILTSDGKAMFFVSDRPNGISDFVEKSTQFHGDFWGNTDIYVCMKNDSGWGEPINLGPKINTPFAERTPFLHPDGRTLYFSSDGHTGFGRLDLYVSTRLKDDSWTEWSEPLNLGKEINTSGEDFGLKISTSGETGYFAASNKKDCIGGSDIFSLSPLPQSLRPNPVVTISGKVTDKNKNPLSADVKWESLNSGKMVGQLKSDPKTGEYFIVLQLGHNYGYYAEKKNYYPSSFNIDLTEETEAQHRRVDIILYSMDTILQISNVFFESGSATLKKESFPELNRLSKIVMENPDKNLEIAGHTDSVGSFEGNMKLSKDRAESVINYLISVGCEKETFIAMPFGPTKPIADNKTPEGRGINRRVEFRFLRK